MPKIQIFIPAYNAARFIGQTIESALAQDVADLEIVVLDNASSDDTVTVVARYADRGVRCIRNEVNIGAIGNHNRALDMATAEFVKLLSADDVLLPGTLAKQVAALDRHPDVGVVSCNCIVTDNELQPKGETRYLPGHQDGAVAIAQCASKIANLLGAPSNTLLRRTAIQGARFDAKRKWLGDLDFVCQVLTRSNFFNIDEPGFLYRRHDATDSLLSCPLPIRLQDEFWFASKYGGGMAPRARILYRAGRALAKSNPVLRHVVR